ncbi:MAG: anaerobic ribonucleoside-triphosphate reductase activating protein [Clostridia bacterium]|nr:anaerobic ribonucleoside-triphosphate reductase activating protein [Clostridia bacterium]
MKVYGLEKLSLVDYDGKIAATVFTGNCNFKCGFCHNAQLVNDYDNLPTYSEAEIFDYLSKRKGVLEGVCVSGGEPTLNANLPSFLEKLKALGYSVKLDTNGTNPQMVKKVFEDGLVDYFAMDIKNDRENYAKIIGFDEYDTTKIEKTVEFLMTSDADYEFRTTLIDNYHKKQNIINICGWISGAKKYCMQKFKDTGSCLNSAGLTAVSDQKAKEFLEIAKEKVQKAILRGYDL